jgi:hypothetical protein
MNCGEGQEGQEGRMRGVTERVRGALTSMIKLADKAVRQGEVIKAQQAKIENLTERMIRMETTLELLVRASERRRSNGSMSDLWEACEWQDRPEIRDRFG